MTIPPLLLSKSANSHCIPAPFLIPRPHPNPPRQVKNLKSSNYSDINFRGGRGARRPNVFIIEANYRMGGVLPTVNARSGEKARPEGGSRRAYNETLFRQNFSPEKSLAVSEGCKLLRTVIISESHLKHQNTLPRTTTVKPWKERARKEAGVEGGRERLPDLSAPALYSRCPNRAKVSRNNRPNGNGVKLDGPGGARYCNCPSGILEGRQNTRAVPLAARS